MEPCETEIIGAEVADLMRLRPPQRVGSLDEFLEFLSLLEAVFGPHARPPEITTGEHFRL